MFLHALVHRKVDVGAPLHLDQMLCFVLFPIATSQAALVISKSVSLFIALETAVCRDPSYKHRVVLSRFLSASTASRVVLDFMFVF